MQTDFKPTGYSTISPYLIVSGAQQTIDFLIRVFDGVPLRQFTDDQGRIAHGEVQIEDSVHVYVSNVDKAYRKALDAGAVSVQAPEKKDDPDRRCGVTDSSGTTWWIATQVEQ
jgi:PhnB protein